MSAPWPRDPPLLAGSGAAARAAHGGHPGAAVSAMHSAAVCRPAADGALLRGKRLLTASKCKARRSEAKPEA